MIPHLKHCPRCDCWLPRTTGPGGCWHRDAASPDGLQPLCRACRIRHRCPVCGAQFPAYDPDQRTCGKPACITIDAAWRATLLAELAADRADRLPEHCAVCGEEFHHGTDDLGRDLDVCLHCRCARLVPLRRGARRRLPRPDYGTALGPLFAPKTAA